MLGGVLVVLIGCYVGLKAWNDHQQEQAEADEEAAKIRLVDAEGLTAVSYTDGESTLGFILEEDTWRYTEALFPVPFSSLLVILSADPQRP